MKLLSVGRQGYPLVKTRAMSADVGLNVVVVGAGFAGISAAKTLKELKYSVVVLEASHRVGGRAWTKPVLADDERSLLFELGATWIHGLGSEEQRNPVYAEALSHGLIAANPRGARMRRTSQERQELSLLKPSACTALPGLPACRVQDQVGCQLAGAIPRCAEQPCRLQP